MSGSVEPRGRRTVGQRLLPAAAVFLVVAGGLYLTMHLVDWVVRDIVTPIVAVAVGGYLAVRLFRFLGRE